MKESQTKIQKLYLYIIPCAVCSLLCCAVGLKYNFIAFSVMCGILLIVSVITAVLLAVHLKRVQNSIDVLITENSTAIKTVFNGTVFPSVICTEQGQVVAKNELFSAISNEMYLQKLFTPEELSYTVHSFEKQIGDKYYMAHVSPIERKSQFSRNIMFVYLVDISLQVMYNKLYDDTKPVVAKVYVDNYDNMSIENDMYSNSVLNKIEERLLHLTKNQLGGIYRREIRSFLIIFEARSLPVFEENIAKLLKDIHNIKTEDGKSVSLSVGVGCEKTVSEAAELASSAIEMALGRGGDQAVVKRSKDASPKYYGDGNNSPEQSNSRVHVRTLANSLRELILDAQDIYIMGHRDEDVDCIGSAIGLMSFIQKKFSKRAFFVCGGGLQKLEDNINTTLPDYLHGFVISPEDALSQQKQDALLIIVDTQREKMLVSPELYRQMSANVVLIDHHRRSEDAIMNTSLSFMESAVSSTCEMVTEMLQSLSEQKKPISKFEATALFAGIAMDTKGFVFNTGRRTFEAAAILKKCGADTTAAMMMYQDDKMRYEAIASLVEKATVYPNRIAISVCQDEIQDARAVIARAADALVSLKGIHASFVLVKIGSNVMVSARSTGEINVQLICESLGGGGHRTVAGAQLAGISCNDALEELKDSIANYFGEDKDRKEKKDNESNTSE